MNDAYTATNSLRNSLSPLSSIIDDIVLSNCILGYSESTMQSILDSTQTSLQFNLNCFRFCITGIPSKQIRRLNPHTQKPWREFYGQLKDDVYRLVVSKGYCANVFILSNDDSGQIAIVFSADHPCCSPYELAQQVNSFVQKHYEQNVFQTNTLFRNSTALSREYHALPGLRQSYLEARKLNDTSFFHMEVPVITSDFIESTDNSLKYRTIRDLLIQTTIAITSGNEKSLRSNLKEVFHALKYCNKRIACQTTVATLRDCLAVCSVCCDSLDDDKIKESFAHMNYDSIELWFQAIQNTVMPVCSFAHTQGGWSVTLLRARYYLQCHFRENVSLPDVAQYVGVSTSYLSTCFKEQLGVSLTDYLTDLRIENSKSLLQQGFKVSKVATAVGFLDSRYFTKIFKAKTGMTPAEFKRNQRSQVPKVQSQKSASVSEVFQDQFSNG